jgi:hypothetical protein
MTGHRFGRWLVVGFAGRGKKSAEFWLCRCDCGSSGRVRSDALRNGHSRSCGCLRRDVSRESRLRHGERRTKTSEYTAWTNLLGRCTNHNQQNYRLYGGRGISVCERWKQFENFLADVGRKPGPGYSIDRIDNDGNYEPGNCRWATASEQRRNQRSRSEIRA